MRVPLPPSLAPKALLKRALRFLALLGFNLLLFALLLEAAGLVYFFEKTQKLYYTSPLAANRSLPEKTQDTLVESFRVHPYFGFVLQPSRLSEAERQRLRVRQNNHGFDDPRDLPFARRHPDELLVGIFGGSVASNLAVFDAREGILAGQLAAATGREPEDVTILNFAQGGYKQPQQVLIYTFFRSLGQELDLVINVDGFNEMALTQLNTLKGIDVGMPSAEHVWSLRKVVGSAGKGEDLERLLMARTSWRAHKKLEERIHTREAWELKFAAGYMIDRTWLRVLRKRFQKSVLAMAEAEASTHEESWFYLADQATGERGPETGERIREALDLWQSSSQMMHTLQKQSGGHYLHVVQPNQYHATERVFDVQEKAVAFSEQSPYRGPIAERYPLLLARIPELERAGVAIRAPVDLFDDADGQMYVDSCCHYTAAGKVLLANAVGEAATALLEGAP
ncbi:MAG: hypothetical protein AAGD06_22030 [Acidobacteriota bacterium]